MDTEPLRQFLESEQPTTVRETDIAMGRLRPLLKPAGVESADEFLGSYKAVTSNIADLVDLRLTHGVKVFKEEEVLDTATPTFLSLFTENLVDPKIHWQWIKDERVQHVDRATRAVLGYNSHIGGDLGPTVHSIRRSERFTGEQITRYLRYDYAPKIDRILWKTAHQLAPALTNIENDAVRKGFTNAFMLGITYGRQIALSDARKMARAKSEDEIAFITERARLRTAKTSERILDLGLELNASTNSEQMHQVQNESALHDRRLKTSRVVAQLIGVSLRKTA